MSQGRDTQSVIVGESELSHNDDIEIRQTGHAVYLVNGHIAISFHRLNVGYLVLLNLRLFNTA